MMQSLNKFARVLVREVSDLVGAATSPWVIKQKKGRMVVRRSAGGLLVAVTQLRSIVGGCKVGCMMTRERRLENDRT